jgi:hypothetical protein
MSRVSIDVLKDGVAKGGDSLVTVYRILGIMHCDVNPKRALCRANS